MARMDDTVREQFLAQTRYGYLTTLTAAGEPRTVPIWYEWDGEKVRIFTGRNSAKVKRIGRDPRITVLIANERDEKEAWVAFDGKATIRSEGGAELATRLAERYWDMSDKAHQETVHSWQVAAAQLCVIELQPEQIRSYLD